MVFAERTISVPDPREDALLFMTKEEIISQSPEDVRLQKNRFSLLCSGNALITFTIWTVIRSLFQFSYQSDAGRENGSLMILAMIILASGIIDVALKLIVGISARAEGLGKHRKKTFIIPGIILIVFTLFSLINQGPLFFFYYYADEGLVSTLVSMAVEATVLFAELDLVISAINVRRIENAA